MQVWDPASKNEYEETYTAYYNSREEAVAAAQALWDGMDYSTQEKRIVLACKAVVEVEISNQRMTGERVKAATTERS